MPRRRNGLDLEAVRHGDRNVVGLPEKIGEINGARPAGVAESVPAYRPEGHDRQKQAVPGGRRSGRHGDVELGPQLVIGSGQVFGPADRSGPSRGQEPGEFFAEGLSGRGFVHPQVFEPEGQRVLAGARHHARARQTAVAAQAQVECPSRPRSLGRIGGDRRERPRRARAPEIDRIGRVPADETQRAARRRRVAEHLAAVDVDDGQLGVELAVEGEDVLVKELVVPRDDPGHVGLEAGGAGQGDERPGDVAAQAGVSFQDLARVPVVLDLQLFPPLGGHAGVIAQVPDGLGPRVERREPGLPSVPKGPAILLDVVFGPLGQRPGAGRRRPGFFGDALVFFEESLDGALPAGALEPPVILGFGDLVAAEEEDDPHPAVLFRRRPFLLGPGRDVGDLERDAPVRHRRRAPDQAVGNPGQVEADVVERDMPASERDVRVLGLERIERRDEIPDLDDVRELGQPDGQAALLGLPALQAQALGRGRSFQIELELIAVLDDRSDIEVGQGEGLDQPLEPPDLEDGLLEDLA